MRKILNVNGDNIDMAELLRDTIEEEGQRARQKKEKCEIPNMLSWLHQFSSYTAIIGSRYQEIMRELWAYMVLMIGEQRRCGGAVQCMHVAF